MLEVLRQNLTERGKESNTNDPGANQSSMSNEGDQHLRKDQERTNTTPTRGTKDQPIGLNTGTSHTRFTGSPSTRVGQQSNQLQKRSTLKNTRCIKLNQIRGK